MIDRRAQTVFVDLQRALLARQTREESHYSCCPVPVSAAKWTIYVAELLDALRRAPFSRIICRISL